eukprot:1515568-Amphidinium_carterae.1
MQNRGSIRARVAQPEKTKCSSAEPALRSICPRQVRCAAKVQSVPQCALVSILVPNPRPGASL